MSVSDLFAKRGTMFKSRKRMNVKPKRKAAGPTARARAHKAAKDARYAKKIRALVAERDGECRIGDWELNPGDTHDEWLSNENMPPRDFSCDGHSEWAHLGDGKRFKTRGMAPEQRHSTARSLMLCTRHHRMYDAGEMAIDGDDANLPLGFWIR